MDNYYPFNNWEQELKETGTSSAHHYDQTDHYTDADNHEANEQYWIQKSLENNGALVPTDGEPLKYQFQSVREKLSYIHPVVEWPTKPYYCLPYHCVAIFDTCSLMKNTEVLDRAIASRILCVIPYTVIRELDHLNKKSPRSPAKKMSCNIDYHYKHNPMFIRLETSLEATIDVQGFANSMFQNDDSVLKTAVRTRSEIASIAYSFPVVIHESNVIFVTEDRTLTPKACAHSLNVTNAEKLAKKVSKWVVPQHVEQWWKERLMAIRMHSAAKEQDEKEQVARGWDAQIRGDIELEAQKEREAQWKMEVSRAFNELMDGQKAILEQMDKKFERILKEHRRALELEHQKSCEKKEHWKIEVSKNVKELSELLEGQKDQKEQKEQKEPNQQKTPTPKIGEEFLLVPEDVRAWRIHNAAVNILKQNQESQRLQERAIRRARERRADANEKMKTELKAEHFIEQFHVGFLRKRIEDAKIIETLIENWPSP